MKRSLVYHLLKGFDTARATSLSAVYLLLAWFLYRDRFRDEDADDQALER